MPVSRSHMSELPRLHGFPRFVAAAFIVALIVVSLSPPAVSSSRTEKNQDIVFLVDVSSSMTEIFDDVRRAIYDYISQVRPGDNVVLISFGKSATLRIRQKISSNEDAELIKRELGNLDPSEYYTNITDALDKGLKELEQLRSEYPDHVKTLVLMSDGKNNPPDTAGKPLTFEEILEKYHDILTVEEGELALFYLSLGKDPDPQVLSFVENSNGLSFDLGENISGDGDRGQFLAMSQVFVEPVSIDLGVVSGPNALVPISIAFFPSRGDPTGNTIATGMSARFKDNPSWRTIVEVKPPNLSCSRDPWSADLLFSVDSFDEGTIIGTLELKPLQGQVLFIEPSEIPVTMTLRQPRVNVAPHGQLKFGPIRPQTEFSETKKILLMPNSAAVGQMIRTGADIDLPDGISLMTSIERGGEQPELVITVTADKDFDLGYPTTIVGNVLLSGATEKITFSNGRMEILIEVASPTGTSHKILKAIKRFFSRYGRWIALAVIVTLIAAIAGLVKHWWVDLRPHSTLEGKLVLVSLRGKPPTKSKPIMLNLNSIGKSLGRNSLVIGSSKDAGITLPHKSVATLHCEISTRMEEDRKRVILEPIGHNLVRINDQQVTEATPLSDRDSIEIGEYAFRFENPHPYKQIVVRYLDGKLLKGTPSTWDIESEGFGLLPRDALPGSTEEIYVLFRDLKAVYFVRDFDGLAGERLVSPKLQIRGVHMELTFHDGEEMEGFASEAYSPDKDRFYFFPADQSGNTISVLVERNNLKNITVLDQPA